MRYWGNDSKDEEDRGFELLGTTIEYYRILLGALFIFIILLLFGNASP